MILKIRNYNKITCENGYAIQFLDLPGTNTQGKDLPEAIYMPRDALATWLDYLQMKKKLSQLLRIPMKLAWKMVSLLLNSTEPYTRALDSIFKQAGLE